MLIDDIKNKKILSIGECLGCGYAMIKQNMTAVLFILLIIYFPINLLSGYVSIAASNIGANIDLTAILSDPAMIEKFISTPEYVKLASYNLIGNVIEMALTPFGAMAVIFLTKAGLEGKTTNYKEALAAAFSNAWRFICSLIVFSVCVSFLSLFAVIPGIFMGVVWYFYLQAIVLDDCRGIKSLGYSRELVKGRWWKTFLYMIVFYLLNYAASYLISMLFMWGAGSYFSIGVAGVVLSFVSMIFVAAKTVVYINFQGNIVNKTDKNTLAG